MNKQGRTSRAALDGHNDIRRMWGLSKITSASEQAKIDCGREHFKALGNEVEFTVANRFSTFADKMVR
ncbi:MAG TPA: hypothetical protein PKW95_22495 [bacterium]|nr:hypothetical protein [bacterium]